jgi:hypothetical protein
MEISWEAHRWDAEEGSFRDDDMSWQRQAVGQQQHVRGAVVVAAGRGERWAAETRIDRMANSYKFDGCIITWRCNLSTNYWSFFL